MATNFRLKSLTIGTNADQHTFVFAAPLTFVTGDVGMGKSSLIMLVKYGLGGDAKLTPAVREHAKYVELVIQAAEATVALRRRIGEGASSVEVVEAGSGLVEQVLPVSPTPADGPSISRQLLELLEIPVVRVPSSRSGINARTLPITFNDVFAYCYLQAKDIDRSVVGHLDPFRNRQRIATFELLFGLTDPELIELIKSRGLVRELIKKLTGDIQAIEQFITNAGYPDTDNLRTQRLSLLTQLDSAEVSLDAVRREVAGLLQSERDKRVALASALAESASSREKAEQSATTVRGREAALAQLRLDLARAERRDHAVHTLAPFEFTTCPRCMQSLAERTVEASKCLLCLQPMDQVAIDSPDSHEPLARLQSQIRETEQLLALDRTNLSEALAEAANAYQHAIRLHREFDKATSSVVSPRLEAVSRLSSQAEAIRQGLKENDRASALWRQIARLRGDLSDHKKAEKALLVDIRDREGRLNDRGEMLNDLTSMFKEEVVRLGIPIDGEPRIDEKSYLPMVGETDFSSLQASGGGASTALNVAYHITLLSYAANRSNVLLPSLLIIDSPRKAIGNTPADRELGLRIYRRFMILAESLNAQLLVADNGVPTDVIRRTPLIELTRERSTVPGILNTGVGLGTRVEDM